MKQLWAVDGKGGMDLHPHRGQARVWESTRRFVAMISGTQSGKALAIDTPIPTPTGFVNMGDLSVGDTVYDENGQPTTVVAATPVQYGRTCYEITFDDGSTIVADADHRWLTQTHEQRKNLARRAENPNLSWAGIWPEYMPSKDYTVRTTADILATLRHRIGEKERNNHSIPMPSAVEYPAATLPIPPYTLGAWLGDGYSDRPNIVVSDSEVIAAIESEGVNVERVKYDANTGKAIAYRLGIASGKGSHNPFTALLNGLSVINNKHIPGCYLVGSIEQRISLLQGLMDTDGYADPISGQAEFCTISPALSADFVQLIRSLGIKARVKKQASKYYGKDCGFRYRIFFSTQVPAFRIQRKLAAQSKVQGRGDIFRRFFADIRPIDSVPVRCIQVSSPSSLYLAGKDYIVTHNTSFGPLWLWREIETNGAGDYLAATTSYDLFKLKMLPEMRNFFEHGLGIGRYWAGDGVIEIRDPATGKFLASRSSDAMYARIILRSAAAGSGLESATAKAAWLDEAGQDEFTLESWEAVLRRLSLSQGRVLVTTTPYNLGWMKTEIYDRWAAGDKDYDVIQFESTYNPAFPRAEYERAQRSMQAWRFAMFYQGLFTRPAGLIYSAFRDEMLVDDFEIPPSWERVIGIDFGGANTATVHLANRPKTNVWYVYHESLGGGVTTEAHVQGVKALLGGVIEVTAVGGAPGETQERRDWSNAGLRVEEPRISGVEPGIDRVSGMFGSGRLLVFRGLRGLRDELGSYRRRLDSDGNPMDDIVDKRHFHRLDALRYACSRVVDPGGWARGASG